MMVYWDFRAIKENQVYGCSRCCYSMFCLCYYMFATFVFLFYCHVCVCVCVCVCNSTFETLNVIYFFLWQKRRNAKTLRSIHSITRIQRELYSIRFVYKDNKLTIQYSTPAFVNCVYIVYQIMDKSADFVLLCRLFEGIFVACIFVFLLSCSDST